MEQKGVKAQLSMNNIFRRIWYKVVNGISFKAHNVEHGTFYISGYIRIYRNLSPGKSIKRSLIKIGDWFGCNSGLKHNPIGGDTCTILRTIDDGKIVIGNNVGISNASLVARDKIEIQDNVLLGGGVKIYDNDFHSLDFHTRIYNPYSDIKSLPVIIKTGAFIGAGSYILKGVTVGEHSIVGAGSVVTKSIPDGEVWAGNPARFIRRVIDTQMNNTIIYDTDRKD